MGKKRKQTVEAIVLAKREFGETDLLVTLLTSSLGKIIAKAPGARKITSRRRGKLELGSLIKATLYRSSRGALPLIIEVELLDREWDWWENSKQAKAILVWLEILDKVVPLEDPEGKVYLLAKNTLARLKAKFEDQLLVKIGELVRILGYCPPSRQWRNEQEIRKYVERIVQQPIISLPLWQEDED